VKWFLFCLLAGLGAWTAPAARSIPIDEAVFFVETEVGTGVAFLMEGPTGDVWMVSNSSAFNGSRKYKITNASGTEISFPDQVFVAKNRDLIRFPVDRPAGLPCAESSCFEEKILVFSNCITTDEIASIKELNKELASLKTSKTQIEEVIDKIDNPDYIVRWSRAELEEALKSVTEQIEKVEKSLQTSTEDLAALKKAQRSGEHLKEGVLLRGQVTAVGPDRIEISARINRYDCGGPVLNIDHEVIGISSYLTEGSRLPNWVTEGTRFKDTRRFALKLDGVEWLPMETKYYQREALFVRENFETLAIFAEITESLNENYRKRISTSTENKDVNKWIKTHNQTVARFTERNAEKDFLAFVEMVEDLEKDSGRVHRVSVPFYKEQLSNLEELYSSIRKRLEKIAKDL
jgi:DNA repair exonuclease SbcCD ATPase subunit